MTRQDSLIINAAITGAMLGKRDSPHLPVVLGEIVDCARRVQDAGAAIVHLHARNPDASPSYAAERYCEMVERVRQACGGLIVCVSLSGRFIPDLDQRAAALRAAPDMASLTLGSMNFPGDPSINAPDTITALAGRIQAAGAVPELEVFEAGFINYANHLIRKEVLRPPFYFNLILGSLGSAPLDLMGVAHMVGMLPPGAVWALGGIGRFQLDANVLALTAGGHVRVGLEDNLYYDRARTELADNVRLVERIARLGREMGRSPASPETARAILGLGPGNVAGQA